MNSQTSPSPLGHITRTTLRSGGKQAAQQYNAFTRPFIKRLVRVYAICWTERGRGRHNHWTPDRGETSLHRRASGRGSS